MILKMRVSDKRYQELKNLRDVNFMGARHYEKVEYTLALEERLIAATQQEQPDWTPHFRDSGLLEWVCKHGVGHPDGVYAAVMGEPWGVHGCDGCCKKHTFPGRPRGAAKDRINAIRQRDLQRSH